MTIRRTISIIIVFVFILPILGCSKTESSSAISIENAWGRPSPTMPTAGGIYMLVKNEGTQIDKLLSGESPACGSIEVHEMVKKEDGTMGMNLVDAPVEIPTAGQVEFKVGGLHIMCIAKNDKFTPGATIDLTLKFEKAGSKTFPVLIKAE